MNEFHTEKLRTKLGTALIYLFKASRRHGKDGDLACAAAAIEGACAILGEPTDDPQTLPA
jgi:hypothetical protein